MYYGVYREISFGVSPKSSCIDRQEVVCIVRDCSVRIPGYAIILGMQSVSKALVAICNFCQVTQDMNVVGNKMIAIQSL